MLFVRAPRNEKEIDVKTLAMTTFIAIGLATAAFADEGEDDDCIDIGEVVEVELDIPDLPAGSKVTDAEGMEMDPINDDSLGAATVSGGSVKVQVTNIAGNLTSPVNGESGDGEGGDDDCWEVYATVTYGYWDYIDVGIGWLRWDLGFRIGKRIAFWNDETIDTEVKVVCPC